VSSFRSRSRVSPENGGSPSITLSRSVISGIRSIRCVSSRSHGFASASVGPFPKFLILVFYHFRERWARQVATTNTAHRTWGAAVQLLPPQIASGGSAGVSPASQKAGQTPALRLLSPPPVLR
jgi:hypothetical protein